MPTFLAGFCRISLKCIDFGVVENHVDCVKQRPCTAVGGIDQRLLKARSVSICEEFTRGKNAVEWRSQLMGYGTDEVTFLLVSSKSRDTGNFRHDTVAERNAVQEIRVV